VCKKEPFEFLSFVFDIDHFGDNNAIMAKKSRSANQEPFLALNKSMHASKPKHVDVYSGSSL